MKKMWLLLVMMSMFVACTKEVTLEETATVISEPTITGEKVVFPVYLEQSKIMAQMPISASKEAIQKGDRVRVQVTDIGRAIKKGWAPVVKFEEKIKSN